MGALRLAESGTQTFVANHPSSAPPMTSLRELEAAAARVERGHGAQADKWVRQLVAPGTTLGGTRPKASLMALSRRGHTYSVKRFDRVGGQRRMYASAQTLLRMGSEGASYLDLVQIIESQGARGGVAADLEQLFRRGVFNVLVANRDDHLRNHGFLRERTGWRLSPAFDVNPNPDKHAHVLALDERDSTPDTSLLLQNHRFFRLGRDRAAQVAEEVRAAVRPWESRAKALGIKRAEMATLGAVIDPER